MTVISNQNDFNAYLANQTMPVPGVDQVHFMGFTPVVGPGPDQPGITPYPPGIEGIAFTNCQFDQDLTIRQGLTLGVQITDCILGRLNVSDYEVTGAIRIQKSGTPTGAAFGIFFVNDGTCDTLNIIGYENVENITFQTGLSCINLLMSGCEVHAIYFSVTDFRLQSMQLLNTTVNGVIEFPS